MGRLRALESPRQGALSWDGEYLYAAAIVLDSAHAQTRPDSSIWHEDSIQIGIVPVRDAWENRGVWGYGPDDFEAGFALRGDRVVRWCCTSREPDPITGFPAAILHKDGVTTYEIALPGARITPDGTVPQGFIGVNMAINASGGGARSACAWTAGILERKNPRAFRNVWLLRSAQP